MKYNLICRGYLIEVSESYNRRWTYPQINFEEFRRISRLYRLWQYSYSQAILHPMDGGPVSWDLRLQCAAVLLSAKTGYMGLTKSKSIETVLKEFMLELGFQMSFI